MLQAINSANVNKAAKDAEEACDILRGKLGDLEGWLLLPNLVQWAVS